MGTRGRSSPILFRKLYHSARFRQIFVVLVLFAFCAYALYHVTSRGRQENGVVSIKPFSDYQYQDPALLAKQLPPPSSLSQVDNNSPFIFIGGIPRSGTTLMRAMLDAHPLVRCGEETRIIPRILALRYQWKRSEKEWRRLQEAGVDDRVINAAISSFIVQVIEKHGSPADRLCNKDPFTLKSTAYLAELFPRSKFIFMIRDGRATVHSIISRKVTITGFDLSDFRQCLTKWNAGINVMYDQCQAVGPTRCIMMWYEQLVLHPEKEMRRLLAFLELPWNESVLHHEMLIGKDISLSKVERSTDQVVKPVNLDALTKWVGQIPKDVVAQMAEIAPMLRVLGYDPNANPPNYGTPDDIVLRQTQELHQNEEIWRKKAEEVVAGPLPVVPVLVDSATGGTNNSSQVAGFNP